MRGKTNETAKAYGVQPDAPDIDEPSAEADRHLDELDAEARTFGYESAFDTGFRQFLPPELRRSRKERPAHRGVVPPDEDEGDYILPEDEIDSAP